MKKSPLRERFMSKFERQPNGCWLWTGALSNRGYGKIRVGERMRGKLDRAHQVSWEIFNGPIPSGISVLHKCDVPRCVNPEHLFLGTQSDNIIDMVRKGRHRKKLSLKEVKQIRRLRSEIGLKYCTIATLFFVSPTAISKRHAAVKRGKASMALTPLDGV